MLTASHYRTRYFSSPPPQITPSSIAAPRRREICFAIKVNTGELWGYVKACLDWMYSQAKIDQLTGKGYNVISCASHGNPELREPSGSTSPMPVTAVTSRVVPVIASHCQSLYEILVENRRRLSEIATPGYRERFDV